MAETALAMPAPRGRRPRGGPNIRQAIPVELERQVLAAYLRPGHPVALSTPAVVAKYFRISQRVARTILEHEDGYTLHREYKQPRVYNPYYVDHRRDQVQADLIDVSKIAAQNDGVRFLLVIIDIMTKKLWVYALRDKTAARVRAAMERWLRVLHNDKPKKMLTDRGNEFKGAPVQRLLQSQGIEWQPALGMMKAAIAERVNKTLQVLIYKYLTAKETLRYLDVLPALVRTYNERPHRTLKGMSPDDADLPANEARVQAIFRQRYTKLARHRKPPERLPYRVGDTVRIKTDAKKISSSSRAYAEQFHGEYFTIASINYNMPVALYYLRSQDTNELIEGGFYAEELQRQRGDSYKIERVLARRTRGGQRQVRVKWKYFSDRHNQWIPAENVREV